MFSDINTKKHTPTKINMSPGEGPLVNGNFISQPSVFREYVSFQGEYPKKLYNIPMGSMYGTGWFITNPTYQQ